MSYITVDILSLLNPSEFIKASAKVSVIDVRSPAEFLKGHIPGSHNIPLFDNDERARVGTIYKQQGKDEAVLEGLKITGPKLAYFVEEARKLALDGEILVYCWRGGMRSGSFSWLLKTAGLNPSTLIGGYKGFRSYSREIFSRPYELRIIAGETGCGKTEILQELRSHGEQVVDLESLANHRGSSFGMLGLGDQPQTEHFENLLAMELISLDPSQSIWVEDESKSIGRVYIPDPFWKTMQSAKIYKISVPLNNRINRLVRMYGEMERQDLIESVTRIQKKLGGKNAALAIHAIEDGDLHTATEIILSYYDSAYAYAMKRRENQPVADIITEDSINPPGAEDLINVTVLQ